MAMRILIVSEIFEGLNNSTKGLEVNDIFNCKVQYFRKCDKGIIVADMLASNNFLPSNDKIIPNNYTIFTEYLNNNFSNEILLAIYKKLVFDKRV